MCSDFFSLSLKNIKQLILTQSTAKLQGAPWPRKRRQRIMEQQKAEPKIPFTVVRCTSEMEEHPATELNTLSPHTSGWLSARFAEFPQEILLQLHDSRVPPT